MKKKQILGFLLVSLSSAVAGVSAATETQINIRPASSTTEVITVSTRLDGRGALTVNPESETNIKLRLSAQLRYDERVIARKKLLKSIRDYQTALAEIRLGNGSMINKLRPSNHLIVNQIEGSERIKIASVEDALTQNELDLINTPANSMVIPELLAKDAITADESWEPQRDLFAQFLNIDQINQSDVRLTLISYKSGIATIQITGTAEGSVDGTGTEISVNGTFVFDCQLGRTKSHQLTLTQHRDAGVVAPGLDAVFKINTTITSGRNDNLSDEALAELRVSNPSISDQLVLHSASGKYYIRHSRSWRVIADRTDRSVLRYVHQGEAVAQCDILTLPPRGDQQQTLDQFRQSILNQLGSETKITSATEEVSETGLEWLRVEANGQQEEVTLHWIYYVVTHADGRRLQFVFTTEPQYLEAFGAADHSIVNSCVFSEAASAKADLESDSGTRN